MFRSSGTGCWMISLKKSSLSSILLSHSVCSSGLRSFEKLLRLRQRRVRQIMAGLEGLRVGNAAAVSREALIARLEQTAASGVFQWEGNRRARVVEDLDLVRRQLAAQHVRIPAAVDVRERLLEDLSAGIALRLEKRQKP